MVSRTKVLFKIVNTPIVLIRKLWTGCGRDVMKIAKEEYEYALLL
jgi:hypothetical protein